MIVIDASIAIAYLIKTTGGIIFLEQIAAEHHLAAPTLIEYEIGSALRRLCLAGKLDETRARMALRSLDDFSLELYEADLLSARSWELRQNVTFYDASYVALAEMLDVPLYTSDKRLASAPGHGARIICF